MAPLAPNSHLIRCAQSPVYSREVNDMLQPDIDEQRVARLGELWKQVSVMEATCFRAATDLGAETQELLDSAQQFANKLQQLSDLQAGLLVLANFGGHVPRDLLAHAGIEWQALPAGTTVH